MTAVVLALLIPIPLLADEPKTKSDTPEAVAGRAINALKEDRLNDFAKDMHPDALKELKSALVSVAEAAAKSGEGKEILALLGDAKSVADLKKLDDQQFFVAFYRGLIRLQPKLKQVLSTADVKIIGHVMEGEDTAHVVHRMIMDVEGIRVSKTDIISMRKRESSWGMLLTGDLENVTKSLKRQFGVDKK
jgi:hypothetical protein